MSRIGKLPIKVPDQVQVEIQERRISVEGPKGKLAYELPNRTAVSLEDGQIIVTRDGDDSQAKAYHGLGRALINNMVKGVSEGFVKKLEIQGVGFRADVQDQVVNLSLGYSHPVRCSVPDQVRVTVQDGTRITIEGCNKADVGQLASEIRGFYPVEPYKGKGVRYSDEKVIRKEGKTVQ